MHVCPLFNGVVPHVGGPITGPGCATVIIGFMPAARVMDMCTCVGPPDLIQKGSSTVQIGFMPAARMGDPTSHGGVILTGCPTVLIGDMTGGGGGGGGGGAGGPAGGAETPGDDAAASDSTGAQTVETAEGGQGAGSEAGASAGGAGAGTAVGEAPAGDDDNDDNAAEDNAAEKAVDWIEIELLDKAGAPQAAVNYRITKPDGSVIAEGKLDGAGRARVDDIDPGDYDVSFPKIDEDTASQD